MSRYFNLFSPALHRMRPRLPSRFARRAAAGLAPASMIKLRTPAAVAVATAAAAPLAAALLGAVLLAAGPAQASQVAARGHHSPTAGPRAFAPMTAGATVVSSQPPLSFFPGFTCPASQGYCDGSFGWSQNTSVQTADNLPRGASVTRMLRVNYPKGSIDYSSVSKYGTPLGGAQAAVPFSDNQPHQYLRYYVRFQPGFQFNKGGKLPGLYGGDTSVASGGHNPDGTNGFSVRLMWRPGGAGEAYAYIDQPSKEGTYGLELGRGNWYWQPGLWTQVQLDVRPNDIGTTNGHIRVFINGQKMLDAEGLKFRTASTLKTDGMFFSTFFGGSDPTWASPQAQHTDFASFGYGSALLGP